MTKILAILALSQLAPVAGWSSHYAPGVMETPAAYHGYEYRDGRYIAVSDCSLIGDYVLIRPEGGKWEIHQIADCAGNDGTPQWMTDNNIISEVSYETAKRWGVMGGGFRVECIGCK